MLHGTTGRVAAALGAGLVAAASMTASGQSETLVGVTTAGQVVTFRADMPSTPMSMAAITGLLPGDSIQGIDYRPQTGVIVAIGQTSQMYTLNAMTGVASPLGSGFSPILEGSPAVRYSVDINPTVDRLRVVGSGAQNRRLNPLNGSGVAVDTPLSYAPSTGLTMPPRAVAVAYTNSIAGAPVGSTREYILDSANNILAEVGTQAGGNASFNGGIISSIFGVRTGNMMLNFDDNAGFDVSGFTGTAYISLNLEGMPAMSTGIYTLNLLTGEAALLGSAAQGMTLRDITVIPTPGAGLLLLAGGCFGLRRRRA